MVSLAKIVLSWAGGVNSEVEEILQRLFYQEPHSYVTEGLGLMLWVFLGGKQRGKVNL